MMDTTVSGIKKSRGRPKVFDREDALEKAMALFWQHGYEGTSLSHLVAATGAKAPTLYAEFTNKEGLFRAVLEHYIARYSRQYQSCLFETPGSVTDVLEAFLTTVAKCYTAEGTPSGCFIVSTASGLAASSQDIADTIKARHTLQDETLIRFLQERQHQGELSADVDVRQIAKYLSCILRGMSVSARDGACCEELLSLVATTTKLLPRLLQIH